MQTFSSDATKGLGFFWLNPSLTSVRTWLYHVCNIDYQDYKLLRVYNSCHDLLPAYKYPRMLELLHHKVYYASNQIRSKIPPAGEHTKGSWKGNKTAKELP